GRSAQPARGVPGRGTRRGESAPRLLEDPSGRRALSGAPSLQPRKGETRPLSYPAPGAADQGRPGGDPRLHRHRASTGMVGSREPGNREPVRLGVPLSKFRKGPDQNRRKEGPQQQGGVAGVAAAAPSSNRVPPGPGQAAGVAAGRGASPANTPGNSVAPLSPVQMYGGGERSTKAGPKAAFKFYHHHQLSADSGRPAPGGVGAPRAAAAAAAAGPGAA
ncbi:unnamed protein product, partial [Ectocarpus fasciculatus]